MVSEVWLHIGTPKSGTSSLQKYFDTHRDVLAGQGLAYLCSPDRASANDLAVAWNRNRTEQIAEQAGAINQAINDRPEERALISSEMFYGLPAAEIFEMLPALADRPLKVLVYLRRQDRYIEAKFLQKSKNARFIGSIQDFIAKFDGSGSDFAAHLATWTTCKGDVTLVPRVLERDRLEEGDVVCDVLTQIGLTGAPKPDTADVNVTPGFHRVQLLQAASRAGIVPPRRLQRLMAVHYPPNPSDRGPILGHAERKAFLDRYGVGNEALRANFFPDWPSLFSMDDLDQPAVETGVAPFTEAQLYEITGMLKVMKQLIQS